MEEFLGDRMLNLVSVVIPAKNEERVISKTIEGIRQEFDSCSVPFEIVVVNDGCTDGTVAVVRKLEETDDRIRVVDNYRPNGFGYAIRKGLKVYRGDVVIIAMADSSDDPKDMIRYAEEMQKGYDCCFGDRWKKGTTVRRYNWFKYCINRLANRFVGLLFGIKYYDITNAFKCYSRKTIEGVKPIMSRHFNVTVELPLKAMIRGFSYTVISTNWYNDRETSSHFVLKEMGSRYLFIILYVLFEKLLSGKDYKKDGK